MITKEVKKMKILLAITKSNWGGAQKYVYDLALNLDIKKFDITVILGGNGELKRKLQEKNIHTISLPSLERDINIFRDIRVFFDLLKIIKFEKPDILHLNSSKIGGTGAIAGRIRKVPKIIFTSHGWAFNENRNTVSKIIIKIIYWLTIILSHKTIAVSNKLIEQIKYWPFARRKIVMIHNGIENIDFKQKEMTRSEIESKVGKKIDGKIWIGSIGELHHIKGHKFVIDSLPHLSKYNISYFIIGEGRDRDNLSKEIIQNGLEDKVFLLGRLLDASKYLKAFDIYIHPSLSEGLPFAIVEAGLAEIPIIASRVGGIPEIIEDNDGLLIKPECVEEITKAIEKIIINPQITKTYIKNLKAQIMRNFSQKEMIKNTEEIYLTKI